MQTLKNIGGVAQRGADGYAQGVAHGGALVGGAASLNTRLQGFGQYRRNQEAAQLSRHLSAGMPRRAPGPRTAAAYAYDYGFGGSLGGASSGTEEQRALLAHVRRNQEAVEAVRNNPPRRGVHHNVNPTIPAAPPPAAPPPAATSAGVERNIVKYASTPSLAEKALGRPLVPGEREERRRQRKPPPWAQPRRID